MRPANDDPVTLGSYWVVSRLGVGGMGRVLLGVDDSGRRVALKVVHAELAADAGFRERFRREVQMAAAAPAWFTAPVIDSDPEAERPWLATAYVEGPSLQAFIAEQGPLGAAGVTALAIRLADGLAALHGVGLVHRDLKPSNVLLADDGPRLIDFGISRAIDSTQLTQTGQLIGTPAYMSPEQAMGDREIGPPSDMFSFGALVAHAASGRSPFAADTATGALLRVLQAEPELGALTGRVREVVQACLAKDPAARPTAVQARGRLREAESVTPPPFVPQPTPAQSFAAQPCPVPLGPTVVADPSYPHAPAGGAPPATSASWPWARIAAVLLATVLVAAAAFGVTLLLSKQGGGGGGGGPSTTTPVTSTGPTGTSVAPTNSTNALLAGATLIDAPADPRFGTAQAEFSSPTTNIVCRMTTSQVRCDVLQREWTAPSDCTGTLLTGTAPGRLSCGADPLGVFAPPVLAYNEAVRFDGVICVSRMDGMRCEDPATGHGFRVAKATYEQY